MPAIVTTYDAEPSGEFVDLLPRRVHPAGVPGYSTRYIADQLPGNVGDPVSSWPGWMGDNPLNIRGGSPVLAEDAGIRGVGFDGVDDTLGLAAFPTPQRTVAVVMRLRAADGVNSGILSEGNTGAAPGDYPALVRTAANQFGCFSDNGTAATTGGTSRDNIKAWGIAFLRMDAANVRARVNATGSALAPAGTGVPLTSLYLARAAGTYGNIIVAEVITWPTMLSDAELGTVQAALAEHYPGLPAA